MHSLYAQIKKVKIGFLYTATYTVTHRDQPRFTISEVVVIGKSRWYSSANCGHPLHALTDNWTHGMHAPPPQSTTPGFLFPDLYFVFFNIFVFPLLYLVQLLFQVYITFAFVLVIRYLYLIKRYQSTGIGLVTRKQFLVYKSVTALTVKGSLCLVAGIDGYQYDDRRHCIDPQRQQQHRRRRRSALNCWSASCPLGWRTRTLKADQQRALRAVGCGRHRSNAAVRCADGLPFRSPICERCCDNSRRASFAYFTTQLYTRCL